MIIAAERDKERSSWGFFQSGALTLVENAELAAATFFSNIKALLREGAHETQGKDNSLIS